MPVDIPKAHEQFLRYTYCRDRGHLKFVTKADTCDDYVAGLQWDPADEARLAEEGRPALTINKTVSILSTVLGEQIANRAEISFQPKAGSPSTTADALSKVWRQIAQSNQLPWVRSDVFADGIVRSRGYYDVRLSFTDSMRGEVSITQLNGKNVVLDPDAEDYDPDTWNDVFITKWLTVDDIEINYSKSDAKNLALTDLTDFQFAHDSIDTQRDSFGGNTLSVVASGLSDETLKLKRRIRVLERQFREINMQEHFIDLKTGDMRPIPDSWDRNRIVQVREQLDLGVVPKKVKRIKWRVTAGNCVLHDAWSPFKHFTPVPYFPLLRAGRPLGIVEHLLGSQQLLNKVSSQELHVANTTANSGWKVRSGALRNMSTEELEQRGSRTGIVLELDELDHAEKIQPNQVPSALDRISYKAEEHMKSISNVTDSMQGNDREDVAARAIQAKQVRGSINFSKMMDNLQRTDYLLARNTLDIVQEYYTEERLVNILGDGLNQEPEQITVNEVTPEGTIANDLTIGEFEVIVTSVPFRASLEDEQFDQAVQLREMGVAIPDEHLIENSRLINKTELAKKLRDQANSPEAQAEQQLTMRGKQAEVAKLEAEGQERGADAALKSARAQKEGQDAQASATGESPELMKIRMEGELKMELAREEMALKREQHQMDLEIARNKAQVDIEIARAKAVEDARLKRAQAAQAAAMQAARPESATLN